MHQIERAWLPTNLPNITTVSFIDHYNKVVREAYIISCEGQKCEGSGVINVYQHRVNSYAFDNSIHVLLALTHLHRFDAIQLIIVYSPLQQPVSIHQTEKFSLCIVDAATTWSQPALACPTSQDGTTFRLKNKRC